MLVIEFCCKCLIIYGGRGGSRTHSPRGNGFTDRRDSPTSPPSHIWRSAEVSIPIPSLVPLVFKTRLPAGAINAPYVGGGSEI